MTKAIDETPTAGDWATWIRALGRHVRRVREFLGLSQEQLARMGGVSQGAVSRLEAGRGLATPLLVVMKVTAALRRAVAGVDPDLLSPDARRLLATEPVYAPRFEPAPLEPHAILQEPELEEIVQLYRTVPDRQRGKVLQVVRATVTALVGDDAEVSGAPRRSRAQR